MAGFKHDMTERSVTKQLIHFSRCFHSQNFYRYSMTIQKLRRRSIIPY